MLELNWTHDDWKMDLAKNIADDLVVLYLGQVMKTFPVKDLFHNPLHSYTLAIGRSFPGMETHHDLGGIRGDAFFPILHNHPKNSETASVHSHVIGTSYYHENGHAPQKGCPFTSRCDRSQECCFLSFPEQVGRVEGGHAIWCHFPLESE